MTDGENIIHIALAFYDPIGTYSRHAGVVMTSIFEHTASPVVVHILHDSTLTGDNRSRLKQTADKFNQEIRFVGMDNYLAKISKDFDVDARGGRYFTRGALFRLFIPDVLDIKKVIYLDCDVVVNMDIAELWNLDKREPAFEGFSIAASNDFSLASVRDTLGARARAWAMKLSWDKYFNSGVLLMNLERIRGKYNLGGEAIKFLNRYSFFADHPDQDFLNSLLLNDVYLIDKRFNRFTDDVTENSILHCIPQKPFHHLSARKRDILYWTAFSHSAWGDMLIENMAAATVCPDAKFHHRHTKDCLKKMFHNVYGEIFYLFGLPTLLKFAFECGKEAYHRFRDRFGRREAN